MYVFISNQDPVDTYVDFETITYLSELHMRLVYVYCLIETNKAQ